MIQSTQWTRDQSLLNPLLFLDFYKSVLLEFNLHITFALHEPIIPAILFREAPLESEERWPKVQKKVGEMAMTNLLVSQNHHLGSWGFYTLIG
jgi:hypothetical protein